MYVITLAHVPLHVHNSVEDCGCVTVPLTFVLYIQFLSRTIDEVDSEEWLLELGNAMADKERIVDSYSAYIQEKSFLFKCLGIILKKSNQKQFVQKALDTMFATVRHSSQEEREVSSC